MFLPSWPRRSKRIEGTTRNLASRTKRACLRCQPLALESLEGRTLLSTYTVDSLGDTGTGLGSSGDLRYAITQANLSPGSTIQFSVTGTIHSDALCRA